MRIRDEIEYVRHNLYYANQILEFCLNDTLLSDKKLDVAKAHMVSAIETINTLKELNADSGLCSS